MHTPISTCFTSKHASKVGVALLLVWYVGLCTVTPILFHELTAVDKPVSIATEAKAVCTGMACSVADAKSGKASCCCAPGGTDTPTKFPVSIGADCTDTGLLGADSLRSPCPITPTRGLVGMLDQGPRVNTLYASKSHPAPYIEGIDKVPILQLS